MLPTQPNVDGQPRTVADIILNIYAFVSHVFEEFAGLETGRLCRIAEQQAGDVRSATGNCSVPASKAVIKVERQVAVAAIEIDAIVANAAPIYTELQAVLADKLGDCSAECSGIRH